MIPRLLYNKKGLTFLELIISFSILAMILVIVLGALRLGFLFWDKGEEVSLEAQEQRMVWSSLKYQLCSMYPYRVGVGNKKSILFTGEKDKMEFVSLFSYYLQDKGGLRYCLYKIGKDEEGEGFSLKVFETAAVNADFDELEIEDTQFRVLLRGLPGFEFEYAAQNKLSEPVEWLPDWKGEEKRALPAEIRLIFEEKYLNTEELSFIIRSKGYDASS
jgi:general secretion pathway protein J